MDTKKLITEIKKLRENRDKCPECKGLGEYYQRNPDCISCDVKGCDKCGKDSHGNQYCAISSTCPTCNGTGQHRDTGELLMMVVESLAAASSKYRKWIRADWGYMVSMFDMGMQWGTELYCHHFERRVLNTFEDHLAAAMVNLFDLCGWLGVKNIEIKVQTFNLKKSGIISDLLSAINRISGLAYTGKINTYKIEFIFRYLFDICNVHEINIERHISARIAYERI